VSFDTRTFVGEQQSNLRCRMPPIRTTNAVRAVRHRITSFLAQTESVDDAKSQAEMKNGPSAPPTGSET
jgi:hypothetical protein